MLLLETSSERGSVAIMDQEKVLFHKDLPYGYQNSQSLLPAIQEGFKQTHLTAQQLNLIAVGTGPGSYTGIRVAAVVAKSIAYACKLPLVGICTLEGFIPPTDGPFAAVIDAKIGGVYLLKGIRTGELISYISSPVVCALNELKQALQGISLLVTPNSTRIEPLLRSLYPDNDWKWHQMNPDMVHLSEIAFQRYGEGDFSKQCHLDLLYLRKTQAEIEREG